MCSACDQEFANNRNSIRPEDLLQYETVSIDEVTTDNTTSESTTTKLVTDNSGSAITTPNP